MIRKLLSILSILIAGLLIMKFTSSIQSKTLTIVALGDSTTAGNPGFQSPAEVPPLGVGNTKSQYAYWIKKRRPEWRVLNRGIGGERSDEIAGRFEKDVKAFGPDLVIVLAGVNDLYQERPASWVTQYLNQIYRDAESSGIDILACTIMPYNFMTAPVRNRMREVNDWIRQTARERGYGLCDLYPALEHPERPGALVSTQDGMHPDVKGYRIMGDVITDALEARLAKR